MVPRPQRAIAGVLAAVALCGQATQTGHGAPRPAAAETARPERTVIYVDDDNTSGPWDGSFDHPYQYIQDGIDHAATGDTIFVLAGTYLENLVVDRSVTLLGEDYETTTIDAAGLGEVVYVLADNVAISGFTVTGGSGQAGIDLRSDGNTIVGNRLTDNNDVSWGAILLAGSSGNSIFENAITSTYREAGIWLTGSSSYNDISRNTFTDNDFYAVVVWLESSYNTIDQNIFSANHGGIWICDASHNAITDNVFANNRFNALQLKESAYTAITGNEFTIGGGITIDYNSRELEYWNTHTIASNWVDGGPVYYYKDTTGLTVPDDAAQVILANCTDCTIEGLSLDRAADPIQLGFSSRTLISRNSITCDWYSGGIFMVECFDNEVSENDLISTYDEYLGSAGIDGIHAEEGSGHVIRDNVVMGFHHGMLLRNHDAVSDNLILRNVVSSPLTGIHVIRYNESTAATTISENIVFDCGSDGIHSFRWHPLSLIDNQLFGNDVSISDVALEDWEEITLSGNTINSKPIYCFYAESDFAVPTDAGQVILVDCHEFVVEGLYMSDCGGVHALYCSNGRISGNIFEDISLGVRLDESFDNVCSENIFTGCTSGIRVNFGSDNNLVCDNVIAGHTGSGVFLVGLNAAHVRDNVIVGMGLYPSHTCGVYLSQVMNSIVSENAICCVGDSGISLHSASAGNEITGNSIASCGWCGVSLDYDNVTGNVISANYLVENGTNAWERDGTVGNSWNDGDVGNFWSDFEDNPGYPNYYEIDGDGDGVDWAPLDSVSRCPFACGDIDGSCGEVDFADFEAFVECWDLSPEDCGDYGCSDLDGNGVIDLADFAIFSRLYGTTPVDTPPDCDGE
jgi:parallel beta-helix repeat protein